jgi:hypothetical protein
MVTAAGRRYLVGAGEVWAGAPFGVPSDGTPRPTGGTTQGTPTADADPVAYPPEEPLEAPPLETGPLEVPAPEIPLLENPPPVTPPPDTVPPEVDEQVPHGKMAPDRLVFDFNGQTVPPHGAFTDGGLPMFPGNTSTLCSNWPDAPNAFNVPSFTWAIPLAVCALPT